MKKILLSLLGMTFLAMNMFAQSVSVATLCHKDSSSNYYGHQALEDAYKNADTGDVITLSSGTFHAVDVFSKSITVRGAGCALDSIHQSYPTIINGDCILSSHPIFEGLYFKDIVKQSSNSAGDFQFIKCRLDKLDAGSSAHLKFTLLNSMVRVIDYNGPTEGYIYNSVIGYICRAQDGYKKETSFECNNSFFYEYADLCNALLTNCIFEAEKISGSTDGSFHSLDKSNSVYNCLAVGVTTGNIFKNINLTHNTSNVCVKDYSPFVEYDGKMFRDDTNFHLTPAAQKTYCGNDGTQVGIYGGKFPYNLLPTNPQVLKFDVAPKTTADGMLKVNIEVSSSK